MLSTSSAAAPAGFGARAIHLAKEPTPLVRKAVASSAAGVLALGLLSLGLVGEVDNGVEGLSAPKAQAAASSVELPDPSIPLVDPLPQRFTDTFTSELGSGSSAGWRSRTAYQAPTASPSASTGAPLAAQNPAAPATRDDGSLATGGLPIPEQACALPVINLLCGITPTLPNLPALSELPELPAVPGLPVPLPGVNIGANLFGQEIGVAISLEDPGIGVTLPGLGTIGSLTPSVPDETGLDLSIGGLNIGLP